MPRRGSPCSSSRLWPPFPASAALPAPSNYPQPNYKAGDSGALPFRASGPRGWRLGASARGSGGSAQLRRSISPFGPPSVPTISAGFGGGHGGAPRGHGGCGQACEGEGGGVCYGWRDRQLASGRSHSRKAYSLPAGSRCLSAAIFRPSRSSQTAAADGKPMALPEMRGLGRAWFPFPRSVASAPRPTGRRAGPQGSRAV